jgi:tetratricopeptide (TPR) repeat protein
MTALATHPASEELARFIEGTLKDPARAEVVEHIADCDDCRITVVDVTAFGELEAKPLRVARPRWWVGIAAAIAITAGGTFFVSGLDPLAPVKEKSAKLPSRLVAARLSGFPYAALKKIVRNAGDDTDLPAEQVGAIMAVEAKAEEVLKRRGDDARMQHAKGVAALIAVEARLALGELNDSDRQNLVKQRNDAVAMLQSAADRVQSNVTYQSDLAAALIATGTTTNRKRAVEVCDRARQLEPDSADALFNRAKALDLLAQNSGAATDATKAIEAYNSYLKVDPSSPWADEARDRISQLRLDSEPQ